MANNEEKDLSEEDAVMNALCRHTDRTKIHSINKENQETSHPHGEEASTNAKLEAQKIFVLYAVVVFVNSAMVSWHPQRPEGK